MKSLYGVALMLLATGALAAMDVAALSRDCDSGKPAACSQLGTAYKNGAGVENIVQATIFYAKGCAIGDPDTNDCYDAGLNMSLAQEARSGKKKLDEAFAQWAKSCDAGNAADCNDVGLVNQMGLGGEKDEGKVGGDCSMLGVMYEMGDGVAKNLTHAAQYYRRACDLRETRSCQMLARIYRSDRAEGKRLFEQACAQIGGCDDFRSFMGGIDAAETFKKSH